MTEMRNVSGEPSSAGIEHAETRKSFSVQYKIQVFQGLCFYRGDQEFGFLIGYVSGSARTKDPVCLPVAKVLASRHP